MSRGRFDAGFTVVELLIGLTVLSLVLVTLVSAFELARRIFGSTNEIGRQNDEIAATRRVLVEVLSQVTIDPRAPDRALMGGPRELAVTSIGPMMMGAGAPVAFRFGADANGGGLTLEWAADQAGPSFHAGGRRTLVAGGSFAFEYFEPRSGWIASWLEHRLPTLVRLRSTTGGEEPVGAEMVFAVRGLAPVSCRPGAGEARCRAVP